MKKLLVFIIVILVIATGAYLWWQNGLQPADTSDKQTRSVVIKPGQGTREIADNLKSAGLIRDPVVFFLLVKKMNVDGKLQAGVFYLSPSMNAEQVLKQLQVGKFDIAITIPEGKRADEIADILQKNFSNYTEDWRAQLNAKEGYLFPDTYYLPKDATIDQILQIMTNNFANKYSQVTNATGMTEQEIVILASMIEREGKKDPDRALISSVLHNRLDEGMKLDIDATVQYALGYTEEEQDWWKKNLTFEDLRIDSPYNTYTNPGLPPGPISNPGLAALIAAANPSDTDYFYYVTDKEGNNHYASTLAEHNKNVKEYR